MSVACPGSWRTLCTVLRTVSKEQPGSSISKWAMIIRRAQWAPLGPSVSPSPSFSQRTIVHLCLGQSCAKFSASICSKHRYRPFSSGSQLSNAALKPSEPNRILPKNKVFSAQTIRSILGKNVDATKGNEMLHLIQEQRLAGTIDRAVPGSRLHKDRALAWLRKNYPVDEEKAILNRLDREDEAAAQPQARREGQTSVYGDSVFDRMRKENTAKRERREAEEKARREAKAKEIPISGTRAVAERPRPSLVWAQKHTKAFEEQRLQEVPQMSFLQRVGPITLMTVTIVSLCVLFAQNYKPPSRAARLLSDIPTAAATVGGLIAINVIVWLAWKVPPLWRPLTNYFLLSPVYPYAASILGNNFSHQVARHLGINMVALWFMGTSCK